jgi:hypothetical protein
MLYYVVSRFKELFFGSLYAHIVDGLTYYSLLPKIGCL